MGTYSLIHVIWTVSLLIIFIGIVSWAWNSRQKRRFDEAARLPLEEGFLRNEPQAAVPVKTEEGKRSAVRATNSESTSNADAGAFCMIRADRVKRIVKRSGAPKNG